MGQVDLFNQTEKTIQLRNGELYFDQNLLSLNESQELFQLLLSNSEWEQGEITIFGKTIIEPRLRCWYGEKDYVYSNSILKANPLPSYLVKFKTNIEQIAQTTFNSVLINYYRDGNDSMGWHQDNEKELGKNPVIASLSLGQMRVFHFKHINLKEEKFKLELTNGSLLIMKGETQHFWKHQIPKSKQLNEPRINLTFRNIL